MNIAHQMARVRPMLRACRALILSWKPAITTFLRQHWKIALAAVFFSVVAVLGWRNYSPRYTVLFNEGQAYLNMGRYIEAQGAFRQAIDLHPLRRVAAIANIFGDKAGQAAQQALDLLDLGSEAQWGLDKASVFESRDREVIWQKLTQFEKRHPDDADIHTLLGKFYLSKLQRDDAARHYQTAISLNPNAADAYFGLCEIYDWDNELEQALAMCEKAIEVSGTTPNNYVTNLAGLYMQKGNYYEALDLLKTLEGKYLYVKFELSKIYQLTHELAAAAKLQQLVLHGLNDAAMVNQPENREAWYFRTDKDSILLATLEDKKCYVNYSLAASLYLNGEQKKALEQLQQAARLCTQNEANIRRALLFDLNLAQKNGTPEKKIDEFKRALPGNR